MTEPLQGLRLEHLAILSIENVQLLLVRIVRLHHFVLALGTGTSIFILLVMVGSEGWDAINYSNCARAVNPRRNALLPNVQVIFFELVQVLELALKFACDKQVLSLFVHPKHVVVLFVELFKLDLVQAESWQAAQISVRGHQLLISTPCEEALLGSVI